VQILLHFRPPVIEFISRFWQSALKLNNLSPRMAERFRASYGRFLDSVISQAERRHTGKLLTPDAYTIKRRDNSGMQPTYIMAALDLHIPDEAYDHPVVREIENLVTDILVLDNVGVSVP
jgi:hypothetical protein